MKKTNITIKYQKPPFWRLLKFFFPDYDPNGSVAVSFGKVVYANEDFDESFKVHEETHLIQQGRSYVGAVVWWIRYVFSIPFRFEQELQAFARQYAWIRRRRPHETQKWLFELARGLSSPLYGSLVEYRKAWDMIINESKKYNEEN